MSHFLFLTYIRTTISTYNFYGGSWRSRRTISSNAFLYNFVGLFCPSNTKWPTVISWISGWFSYWRRTTMNVDFKISTPIIFEDLNLKPISIFNVTRWRDVDGTGVGCTCCTIPENLPPSFVGDIGTLQQSWMLRHWHQDWLGGKISKHPEVIYHRNHPETLPMPPPKKS